MVPIVNHTKKRRVRSTISIHQSRHRGKKTLLCGPGYFFNFAYIHTFTQGADLNLVVAKHWLREQKVRTLVLLDNYPKASALSSKPRLALTFTWYKLMPKVFITSNQHFLQKIS